MEIEEHTALLSGENPITRLPPDIIEGILLRLPVSSLLRLRRVCKQWWNMISAPRFIKQHAYCAPKHLLLYLPKLSISASLHSKTAKPCHARVIDEKWSPSTWAASHMDPDDHLFASCNGLLCFYKTYTLKISNPATGQCLHLLKPNGILLHDFHYLYSFGFHPITGEYKLVHFLREPQRYKSGQPFHFDIIQVYTLGEDKWRDIKAPISCCMVHLGVVNVDGAMYWLTEDEGTSCGMAVVSFDLREEMFALIQLPALEVKETASRATPKVAYYMTEIDDKVMFALIQLPALEVKETASRATPKVAYYMTEIDDKVCVVTMSYQSHAPRWRRYNAELSGTTDIWALESDKWFLKYSIQSPSLSWYVPQPCFIRREKIILQDRDSNVWYHDLRGKTVQIEHGEEVKLLHLGDYRFYETQSYFYKETLTPLSIYAIAAIVRAPPGPLAPSVSSN